MRKILWFIPQLSENLAYCHIVQSKLPVSGTYAQNITKIQYIENNIGDEVCQEEIRILPKYFPHSDVMVNKAVRLKNTVFTVFTGIPQYLRRTRSGPA